VTAPLKRSSHQWGFNSGKPKAGGGGGVAALISDRQALQQEARVVARGEQYRDKRRWKADQKDLLDEMLPKATGGVGGPALTGEGGGAVGVLFVSASLMSAFCVGMQPHPTTPLIDSPTAPPITTRRP